MRFRIFIWIIVLIVLSACASPGIPGKNPSSQEGMKLAKPIVMAIEHFNIEHNRYPKRLNELVPHQLESLPFEDLAEKQFQYQTFDTGQRFVLAFIPEANQRCDYEPQTRWVCRTIEIED